MQAVKEHCCDTGRVKGTQWNPSIRRTSLLRQLKCPYQGVLILGVGLYVRVLITEVPFFLRGVSLKLTWGMCLETGYVNHCFKY